MTKPLGRLFLIFILVAVACSFPAFSGTISTVPLPQAVSQHFVTAGPDSTVTATPFQPVGPTRTPVPTKTPVPEATETPEGDGKAEPIPTPIRISQDLPEGVINFLILGADTRPGQGFRTDVIMLVSVNTGEAEVNVISFPRDLYVTIPGWTTQRINTAFPHGGFSTLADTFQYNFGVRPTFFVMTNFEEFVSIINSMGGIDVQVGSFLSDSCDLPQSRGGRCTVYPGTVKMDGATALWYVRSRHSSNDFDRGRRAQEVTYAIFSKIMRGDVIARAPEIYASYNGSVDTNMSLNDILPLLPVALEVSSDPNHIHRYSLGPAYVYDYVTSEGAMVLLPNYNAIMQLMSEVVFN